MRVRGLNPSILKIPPFTTNNPPLQSIIAQQLIGRRDNIPVGVYDDEGFELMCEEILFGQFGNSKTIHDLMFPYTSGGAGYRRIDKLLQQDFVMHPDIVAALMKFCKHLEGGNNVTEFMRSLGAAHGWTSLRSKEDGSVRSIIYRRITT
jgi:hypothetical protein